MIDDKGVGREGVVGGMYGTMNGEIGLGYWNLDYVGGGEKCTFGRYIMRSFKTHDEGMLWRGGGNDIVEGIGSGAGGGGGWNQRWKDLLEQYI